MTRLLVVILDGIGCRAAPDSCMMLFSCVTSMVLTGGLVGGLHGIRGSV